MRSKQTIEYTRPEIGRDIRDRIERLKTRSLSVSQEVCPERARYYTRVYRDNPSDPLIIIRAKALREGYSGVHWKIPLALIAAPHACVKSRMRGISFTFAARIIGLAHFCVNLDNNPYQPSYEKHTCSCRKPRTRP